MLYQRFLDVTKANLFFAHGVLIVEGDAESILLPTLARLIGRDLTDHGVSVVNVGGTGLRRYARIFQRAKGGEDELEIPVACITDMDVMPDYGEGTIQNTLPKKRDFANGGLEDRREGLKAKADGQSVRTFVAGEWTLEYDLAYAGMAEEVYVAARLAIADARCDRAGQDFDDKARVEKESEARNKFREIEAKAKETVQKGEPKGSSEGEVLACRVYAEFAQGSRASKAVAAQYLVNALERKGKTQDISPDKWRGMLPPYIIEAIEYVTTLEGSSDGGVAEAVAASPRTDLNG